MPPAEDHILQILHDNWGYDQFRGIQRDIIDSILAKHDTLGLMPTGGGKSITFQVPALAQQGVCLVITPLVALMKDQVLHLRQKGIKAAAIYSSMSRDEIITTLENAIFGGVKLLYVSPERLSSEIFLKKLKHIEISFITVDEAHCISQWGYDFRPSYLSIADIRSVKPEAPILALTATATPSVVDDIQDKLGFKEHNVFRMSFERKNLAYIVRKVSDKEGEMVHILQSLQGSAIIYVRSRKKSKDIAQLLCSNKISATYYHAGLDSTQRDSRQQEWQKGEKRVMVATNAFGMGIDKPDVRLVLHMECPDSIEAYFQEAGRAGRDGLKAYAVMLYNDLDRARLKHRVSENFPEKDFIRQVYEHLAYYYQIGMGSGFGHRFEFDIEKFCITFKHFPIQTNAALHILTKAGYINYEEEAENRAQVKMLLQRDELYRLDSLNEQETSVITALLRDYGGLFADFCYINEGLVALHSGLTSPQVYDILKKLNERRILKFIPQKKIPHITYTQRREEMERLVFRPEIYEHRKEKFVERMEAIVNYVTNDDICRSKQLLLYFGEKQSHDCMQCDVCIAHNKPAITPEQQKTIAQHIMQILADGKMHSPIELYRINGLREDISQTIQLMVCENQVEVIDGMLSMRKTKKKNEDTFARR
ncbi:MAG: RecQ family ATP-dependent DNA helicase [Bacteroidales bacterium]|nr:RecQ family ATP-dependent DNA helicase [Bacteroidales bacterium]